MKAAIITTSPLAKKAMEIARAEVSVCEMPDGTHDGPRVREYLAVVNLSKGHTWSMPFLVWCYAQAAKHYKLTSPLLPTAGVYAQYELLRPSAQLIDKAIPSKTANKAIQIIDDRSTDITAKHLREGDIYLIQYTYGIWHCGIIEKVTGDSFIGVEGCVNSGNSRNNIGVFEKRRKIEQIKRIIRVI